MIKAVLFDFGGVLTESGKQGFIGQTIAELYDIPYESIDIADLHGALRRGQTDDKAFFNELNRRYGHKKHVTRQMFLDKTHDAFKPSPPVYELAKQLREHGIRTAILSNIFDMNAQMLLDQGWYEGFDPLLLSYQEGYAKPDPEIYTITVERLGVRPDEILFIDDQQKCLKPAEEAGMRTLQAVSPKQVVADTKKILKQQNGITL